MLGAIIGDIVGSPYEFMNVYKRSMVKPFENTVYGKCQFTDDTALTLAVARALVNNKEEDDLNVLEQKVAEQLKNYYHKYPLKRFAGLGSSYGGGFQKWIEGDITQRRTATTNGATMRVAPVGWLYSTMEETLNVAEATVRCSHNSEESVTSAQSIAAVIFLARHTKDKELIKEFVERKFHYQLIVTKKEIENIRKRNKEYRDKQKQKFELMKLIDCDAERTAINAITAFLISDSFEDCIKTAISLGGDSDTIASIAGGIAEAYYGIPVEWKHRAITILEKDGCEKEDIELVKEFYKKYATKPNEDWEKEIR